QPVDSGFGYLCVGQLRDSARAVGYPIQHSIMEGQQHSVTRGVHVGLQVAVAEGDRLLERMQAVLAEEIGSVGCSTAMRECRKRHIEERIVSGPHALIVPS